MAKDKNNILQKKSGSSKPYDVSTSFVKQVTNRVSHLLPRLTNWFAPQITTEHATAPPKPSNESSSEDDDEEDDDDKDIEHFAPPPKRARSDLNQQLPASLSEFSSIRNTFAHLVHEDRLPSHNYVDAAVAGPSGIAKRHHLVSSTPAPPHLPPATTTSNRPTDQIANGDEHSVQSDSSMSTSGCSSLVPQGKYQTESRSYKKPCTNTRNTQRDSIGERDISTYLQSSRSIFPNNSFSPRRPTSSLGKGRPSFSASVFSSPLSSSLVSTSSDRVPYSPFYSGRTQYGGASAYRKPRNSLFTPNEVHLPARQNIQVKSSNNSSVSDLNSCTARRILDALDNLSSPVLDAKRIPVSTSPVLANSRKRAAPDASPIARVGGPSIQDLTIPTVPDLLKLQRRAKMQDSMEAARKIASSSSSSRLTATEREYKMRLDSDEARPTGKIKITSKMKDLEEEMGEEVQLPNIALPISTLPKFDFAVSKPPPPAPKYRFSEPTALDSKEFFSTEPSADNLKFAVPSQVESSGLGSGLLETTNTHNFSKVNSVLNFIPSCPSKSNTSGNKPTLKEKSSFIEQTKNNGQNGKVSFGIGVTGELKTGSVMDLLAKKEEIPSASFGDAWKPAAGSWECSSCMLRNKNDAASCVSCTTPRVAAAQVSKPSNASPAFGFGAKFAQPPGSWECSSCMVRNKGDASSCVACTTSNTAVKISPKIEMKSTQYPTTTSTGFGNQFKPSTNTWKCPVCMIRNENIDSSCISCTTTKPGLATTPTLGYASTQAFSFGTGFGNQFKPSTDTWECSACMVRNKCSVDFCIACETKKPGTGTGTLCKAPVSVKPPEASGFGNMFKKPEGSWECPDCMLSNKDVTKCAACEAPKPGTKTISEKPASTIKFNINIPPEASGFKFGIDKADVVTTKSEAASTSSFQFGLSKPTAASSTGFTFGMPTTTATTLAGISPAVNNISTPSVTTAASTPTPSFSFGAPAPVSTGAKTSKAENGPVEAGFVDRKRKSVEAATETSVQGNKLFASSLTVVPSKPVEVAAKGTFNFGSAIPAASTNAPSMSFNGPDKLSSIPATSIAKNAGPPTTTSELSTTPMPTNLFSFGAEKPTSSSGGFSSNALNRFGATTTTLSTPPTISFATTSKPSAAMFSFGSSTTQPTSSDAPAAKKMPPNYESTIMPKDGSFGALASSGLNFGSTTSAVPKFGSMSNKVEPSGFNNSSASTFGGFGVASAPINDTPAKTPAPFMFGASSDVAKPATTFSANGTQDVTLFGNATPKAASFTFGSQSMTANVEPATSGFNFNVNQTPQKAAGTFTFGSSTNQTSFSEVPAANPTTSVFGSAASLSTFGGSSAAQPSSGGFNFGASAQPTPTVFGFSGQSSTLRPPTPAFAFGQSQGMPAPTFNPNVRPTFNFTGGDVPQFTAAGTANPLVAPGRRIIKKAVRRAPR